MFSLVLTDASFCEQRRAASSPNRGAVLLEVVLALTLFVAAATVISGGLHASVSEVERLRRNLHATDLAVSLMSEIQLGLRPAESAGPNVFDPPFQDWTWQIVTTPLDEKLGSSFALQSVEVVIRHTTESVVRRLTQVLPVGKAVVAAPDQNDAPPGAGGSSDSNERAH